MICRVCSTGLDPWGVSAGMEIPLLRCRICGAIHADCPKPKDDLYAELYGQDDPVPAVIADSLDKVVASLERHRTHGRWLDVGFGQGALLDAVARGGWSCYGTELSEVALRKGHARGFSTATGTETFENGTFDVVSMVELIEHVENPAGFLKEARRVLRENGCLYITTPNAWSLNRWILGANWTVFGPPDHVTIFTPPSLKKLLRQNGFRRSAFRLEGFSPFEIIRRAQKAKAEGFHRVNEGTALCTSMASSPGRRRLKRLINLALTVTQLGDSQKVRST